jgi:MFS family permease
MELIGMAVGSIVLGQVADRIGRRPTVLGCLATMATGMLLAALSTSVLSLAMVRLLTGLGIGGMLACISAIAADSANARRRTMAVAIVAAGYPLGAVIGGTLSSSLLVAGGWRDVFFLGAGLSALFIPIAFALLPESLDGILHRNNGEVRLARVNRTLRMLGHSAVEQIKVIANPEKPRIAALFEPSLRAVTLLLIAAYFLHMMTFYFMLKWIPKIVADLGVPASQAAFVLVWTNIGAAVGSLIFSLCSARWSLRPLMITALFSSAVFLVVFGFSGSELSRLSWAAAAAGFATNATIVGLYALIATAYPASLRAGGIGLVIGVGRGGAALGPILGGILFSAGLERGPVTMIMACGSLLAIIAIAYLLRTKGHVINTRQGNA